MKAVVILLVMLAAVSECRAQAGGYVVLPASAAKEAGEQCSRGAPKVEGGWMPGGEEIAGLEKRLPEISKLEGGLLGRSVHILHPEESYRQYLGVVVDGRRYVYVNAGSDPSMAKDSRHVAVICDGGPAFWGVLYDPATKTFSALKANGYP